MEGAGAKLCLYGGTFSLSFLPPQRPCGMCPYHKQLCSMTTRAWKWLGLVAGGAPERRLFDLRKVKSSLYSSVFSSTAVGWSGVSHDLSWDACVDTLLRYGHSLSTWCWLLGMYWSFILSLSLSEEVGVLKDQDFEFKGLTNQQLIHYDIFWNWDLISWGFGGNHVCSKTAQPCFIVKTNKQKENKNVGV